MAPERTARALLQMLAGAALSALIVPAILWAGYRSYESVKTEEAQQSEAFLVATTFIRESAKAKEAVGNIIRLDLRHAYVDTWPDGGRVAVYRMDVSGVNGRGEVNMEVENHGHGWDVVNAHMFMTGHRFVILHERSW
jgi:hypothetical protein